ncbi:MAG: hypothetical protein L3J59_13030 [Methylococcaceae bacterium]|nr:hypothetical protein [Methylococcaceae bacterium]
MKKRKKESDVSLLKNPVAKFAYRFNKARVFKDKTKYQRKVKHKQKKSFPMIMMNVIGKDFFCFETRCFLNNDVKIGRQPA